MAAIERPIFFIGDHVGRGVVASDAYCELTNRDRSAIVGVSWEEWVMPGDIERSRARSQRVIGGASEQYMRRIGRRDGRTLTVAATSMPIFFGRTPHILTSVQAVFEPEDARIDLREHQAEVALYIEALAGGLAQVVLSAGLGTLRDDLTAVAGEAGRLAMLLGKRHAMERPS